MHACTLAPRFAPCMPPPDLSEMIRQCMYGPLKTRQCVCGACIDKFKCSLQDEDISLFKRKEKIHIHGQILGSTDSKAATLVFKGQRRIREIRAQSMYMSVHTGLLQIYRYIYQYHNICSQICADINPFLFFLHSIIQRKMLGAICNDYILGKVNAFSVNLRISTNISISEFFFLPKNLSPTNSPKAGDTSITITYQQLEPAQV